MKLEWNNLFSSGTHLIFIRRLRVYSYLRHDKKKERPYDFLQTIAA